MKKKLLAISLTFAMLAGSLVGCGSNSGNTNIHGSAVPSDNAYGLREEVADGAILHCFSWSFKTITESMEDIAMAGFSTIQTSPINACYDGGDAGIELFGAGKWYYHYQPTDWTIGNYQLGTKEEFKEIAFKAFIAHSKGDTENALIYKTQALKLMERIKAIEEEKTKYNPKR